MAIEIGNLVVEMSANVARLQTDMNKAGEITRSKMGEMSKAMSSIRSKMDFIVGSQIFQSLDLLAQRGMQAFSAIKHSAIDAADELNKLSQKTGFSTESLSGLKYAAELSDLSLEGLTKGLKGLSVNMVEARGGSKEMAETFSRLGISLEDPEAALMQLADRFQQMPDGAQKARDAVKLFGKEGLAMIPFLNQGRDGIAELTAEAQQFGLIIDSETARQAEAFNDNLTRLQANIGGLVQQLGTSMLPVLMTLSESLLATKTAVGGFDDNVRKVVGNRSGIEGFVESFARGMAHLYNMIMPVIVIGRQLYDVLKGVAIEGAGWAAQIAALASGNISGFRAIREAVQRDAEQLRKDSDAFIARISTSAQGAAGNVSKFFDEHRRTVRSGSQKYLMDSEQDAKLLQAALDKAYKGAGRSVKDYDAVLSASSKNSKKAADDAAARLASIKNADLDLDFAKVAAETEAIYARSQVLVKLQQNAIDAYADSLNDAAFAAADLQIKFNALVDDNAQKLTETAQANAASLGEEIEALRLRNEEIGLTAEQLDLLTQSRLDTAIAAKEQLYADTALTDQTVDYLAALGEQIKLLREKKGLLGKGVAAQAAAEELKAQASIWKSIEQTAHDTFVSILDGGKDAFTRLRDTLKNTVFDLLYQMTIKKWVINAAVSVGGVGAATQAFGAGAVADSGAGGGALSLASMASSAIAPGALSFMAGDAVAGAASMLGASTGVATGLGAFASAAIPVIGWIAAIGSMLGLFGGKPSNKAAGGMASLDTGEIAGTWAMSGDKQASQETLAARDAILQSVVGFKDLLGRVGGSASMRSVAVDVGERDGIQFAVDGGKMESYGSDVSTAIKRLFGEMIAGTSGLEDHIKAMLSSFDGSGADLAAFAAAVVTLSDYIAADPLGAVMDQIDLAGRTALQTWQDGNAKLRSTAAAFDGSLASAQALSTATQAQYQMELNLIGQIQGLLQSTNAMFGSSIRDIQMSVLDNPGKYDFLRTEVDNLFAQLQTAMDPTTIGNLAQQINTLSNQAYGLLDDTQKKTASGDFIAYLEDVNALTTERLNATQSQIVDQHKALASEIKTVMQEVADDMLAAAVVQREAAATQLAAAKEEQRIRVELWNSVGEVGQG